MVRRLTKYIKQYLDTRVIYTIDLALSVISSSIVLVLIDVLDVRHSYFGTLTWIWLLLSLVSSMIAMAVFKSYKKVIRHTTIRDFVHFLLSVFLKVVLMGAVMMVAFKWDVILIIALVSDLLLSMFLLMSVRMVMIMVYDRYMEQEREEIGSKSVLIYGVAPDSVTAIDRVNNTHKYHVVGFISHRGVKPIGWKVAGLPVHAFDNDNDLLLLIDAHKISAILFTNEEDARREGDRFIQLCHKNNVHVLIIPPIDEMVGGKFMRNNVREIKIEDLLGRPEIKISMDEIKANFEGKVVMVTGAAGSIGSELCRQLANFNVKQLILFDNAETPMHNVRLEFEERFPNLNFNPVIGDVRHKERLDFVFRHYHPQVVFHAAAYKHVPLMEENPCEAVRVNVCGTRYVADKCIEYDVEKMVMISTDKAVNPTNIMGCTKRLAEIYVQSLGLAIEKGTQKGKTKFVTTRFGNVLGSNGSVIPRFREQIAKGGPVTVTDKRITRFFMTIPEACRLVMEAATMSVGNQIFVFDMGESVKIDTLARRMIELAGLVPDKDIQVEYTGLRPGEKLYEEVLSNTENTDPTSHDRIRVAKVRKYQHEQAVSVVEELEKLSLAVDIPNMVQLMKKAVPEFKSQNSPFEKYDK